MDAATSSASAYDLSMDAAIAPMEANGLTADEKESLEIFTSAYCEGFENGGDSDFRLASWIKGFMFARALFAPKPYMASIASASQSVHIDLSDTPRKHEVYQREDIEAELPSDHVEATFVSTGNPLILPSHTDVSSQTVHSTLSGATNDQEAPLIEYSEDVRSSDTELIAPTTGNSFLSDGQAQSPGSPNSSADFPGSTHSSDEENSTQPTTPSVTADLLPDFATTPIDTSTQQPIFIDLTVEDRLHDEDCQISRPQVQRGPKRKQSHEGKRRTPKRPRLEREVEDGEFTLRVVSVSCEDISYRWGSHQWPYERFAQDTECIDTMKFLVNSGNFEKLEFEKTQWNDARGPVWEARDAFGVWKIILPREDIETLIEGYSTSQNYTYTKRDN